MKLRIQLIDPAATMPTYATDGAACFDLYAAASARVYGRSNAAIRTGLSFEVPWGYALMIYSRSGHGFKHGIRLANATGVVDSDYRGEVLVCLHNDSLEDYIVAPGDRIAQAMLIQAPMVRFEVAEQLSITDRGAGGFGSTGK
ncbi:dUTP diphosphatase [Arthrospira platensis SPKY1]|nr:dUTP diphosphatase [Arthrospira platensis SPKY1]